MKADTEGEYVAKIIQEQKDTPRSFPKDGLRRLYLMSPNSRYSLFAAFAYLALIGFLIVYRPRYVSNADNITLIVAPVLAAGLVVYGFMLPLKNARKIRYAIQYGVDVIGKVERVRDARSMGRSTASGMMYGAIRALVSYTLHGQPYDTTVFLDRTWVSAVKEGTLLRLLIDPTKGSVLYIVGIADQEQRRHSE